MAVGEKEAVVLQKPQIGAHVDTLTSMDIGWTHSIGFLEPRVFTAQVAEKPMSR